MSWGQLLVLCILATATYAAKSGRGHVQTTIGHTLITINDVVELELNSDEGPVHKMVLGESIPLVGQPSWSLSKDKLSAAWENGIKLLVTAEKKHPNLYGVNIKWSAPPSQLGVSECIDLGEFNWYGGSELYNQPWPIQGQEFTDTAFVPNGQNGGVLERYFLSSGGFAVYVGRDVPLFVNLSTSDNTLCFRAAYETPYRNTDGRDIELDYKILNSDAPGLLLNHMLVVYAYLAIPTAYPEEKVLRYPIWSTWAKYKGAIDQDTVLAFAQEISDNGFPASQIEIDDNWEGSNGYGSEVFDPVKFPDPASMVATINGLGYDVTIWVHPFINTDSSLYEEAVNGNYLVHVDGYETTGSTSWWDGSGGIIDVTNADAAAWWYARLDNLKTETGITAYKFDAGETHFLPADSYLYSDENLQPGSYSTAYANFAAQFGGQVEARVGYGSQELPLFVRILDRDSRWGLDNGLHSVITSTLHFGIVGYPFVLPDYIGGNAYDVLPDRELFIRWVELNAFLPVMQFSITPWSYDDEVIQISRKMVELHYNVSDYLLEAANFAVVDGYPMIRPLWWLDPSDAAAQSINDEFMVGDSYLIAPIVTQGAVTRDIYLPIGDWVDMNQNVIISGPIWLYDYSVPLDVIPYFTLGMC